MTESDPRPGARQFPETHWSQVFRAGDPGDPRHREHLNGLLRHYWKPAYHYVRAMRPLSPADAEDLTQGFFVMMLTRVDFAELTPDKGSFRGFLKIALRRFLLSSERKVSTQVERNMAPLLPFEQAEDAPGPASDPPPSPEAAFDQVWARDVLDQMLGRLETELVADGKRVYFDIFRAYHIEKGAQVSYQSVAAAHGLNEDAVRNYLRVVRQRGREILKDLVSSYLLPGENLEEELRFVLGGR